MGRTSDPCDDTAKVVIAEVLYFRRRHIPLYLIAEWCVLPVPLVRRIVYRTGAVLDELGLDLRSTVVLFEIPTPWEEAARMREQRKARWARMSGDGKPRRKYHHLEHRSRALWRLAKAIRFTI